MCIPFAIHRSGSVVPVGRIPGLHSGCALGLVPASGDLLRFARGLSVFGTDVRRSGVPEGVEGAHGNGRIMCVRRLQTDRICWPLGYAQGRPLHSDRQWYRRGSTEQDVWDASPKPTPEMEGCARFGFLVGSPERASRMTEDRVPEVRTGRTATTHRQSPFHRHSTASSRRIGSQELLAIS
jgi:hypothetical protein